MFRLGRKVPTKSYEKEKQLFLFICGKKCVYNLCIMFNWFLSEICLPKDHNISTYSKTKMPIFIIELNSKSQVDFNILQSIFPPFADRTSIHNSFIPIKIFYLFPRKKRIVYAARGISTPFGTSCRYIEKFGAISQRAAFDYPWYQCIRLRSSRCNEFLCVCMHVIFSVY